MSSRNQMALFFAAVACLACCTGIHDSIFNNFLSDTFAMSASARGRLELPREMPGFLVFLTVGAMAALPLTRVGIVGAGLFGLGMFGLGLLGTKYLFMVAFMFLGSMGLHILQPVGSSVVIGLSDEANRGRRMGQMGLVDTLGALTGAGLVWLTFDKVAPQYRAGFMCAGALACCGALLYSRMHVPSVHKPRARAVFRWKYSLYYALEFVFGARKQIFITFGPWVLIKVYGQPATSMAKLYMIAAFIGIGFKPLAGMVVDWLGERTVMILEGLTLVLVCLGYGYALRIMGDPERARLLACACFVGDNLLFALASSRIIYVSRRTHSPEELTSTLAMGVSINHVVSMTIPIFAGAMWMAFGYERVFLGAACLALVHAALATRVPSKRARLAAAGQ